MRNGNVWIVTAWLALAFGATAGGCGSLATSESARTEAKVGPGGGTVTLGELTLVVPEGALGKEVDLVVRKVSDHPTGNIGPVFSIEPEGGTAGDFVAFLTEVTLSITVPGSALKAGQDYGDLKLAHAQAGAWVPLAGSVADAQKGQVSGQTTHLSVWAVVVAPACDGPEDCADGQVCNAGFCASPVGCNVWDMISKDDLATVGQCYLDKVDPAFADLEKGKVYYPSASVAGFVANQALYDLRTLFTVSLEKEETEYRLVLPCSGLSVTFSGQALKQAPMAEKAVHIVPPECLDGQECACDHCVRAVVSVNGQEFPATEGELRLRCPPGSRCAPLDYCFESADIDLGDEDGKRQWLRLNSSEAEMLSEAEWISTMEALETPAPGCPFALGTELLFYDNTCFWANVKCGGEHQRSTCHMTGSDDGMCTSWETGGEGWVIGVCDLEGITCEKPAVWDIAYAVDAPSGDCEFCWGSDDKNLCVPLDVQCGGAVELPPQVASGSKENGPHPMAECTDWAVCPKDLQECYASFPEGEECVSGRMNVRFVTVPFGGDELCKDAVAGPDEPKECVFYYDSPNGNPTYCCNGYVANRTNWLVDGPYFECCKAYLAEHHPGEDFSAFIDKNGRYNSGMPLDPKYKEPSAWNLVCLQWFESNGESRSDPIFSASDIAVQIYKPEVVTTDSGVRVLCDPDAKPIFDKPVPGSDLGIVTEGKWLTPSGEDCNDIQEAAM